MILSGGQRVEHGLGLLTGPHRSGQVGVFDVRDGPPPTVLTRDVMDEAVDDVDRHDVGPAGGVVKHPAAADRRKLVPIPDQRDAGAGLVGDGEQGAGGVLV